MLWNVPALLGYTGVLAGGRFLARRLAGRLSPGCAMVEPIVCLRDGGDVGYELLYRPAWGKPREFPYTKTQWRAWYQLLCTRAAPGILDTIDGWVAINLDDWQLADPWILASVAGLAGYGERVIIEWTEYPVGPPGKSSGVLRSLRNQYGFRLSIDDAGAGRDAISRIISVEPEVIKIDGGLFHKTRARGGVAEKAVEALISISERVNARVVIEHVETAEDLARAIEFGAQYGQGWLWPGRLADAGFGARRPAGDNGRVDPAVAAIPKGVAGGGCRAGVGDPE